MEPGFVHRLWFCRILILPSFHFNFIQTHQTSKIVNDLLSEQDRTCWQANPNSFSRQESENVQLANWKRRELDIGRSVPRSRLGHKIKVVLRNAKQLLRIIITLLPHDEIRGSEVETATLEGIAHVDSSSHGRNDKANKAKG
jgi:hypothetical protein